MRPIPNCSPNVHAVYCIYTHMCCAEVDIPEGYVNTYTAMNVSRLPW